MSKLHYPEIAYPNTKVSAKCIHCTRLVENTVKMVRHLRCEIGEKEKTFRREFICDYFRPKETVVIKKNRAAFKRLKRS